MFYNIILESVKFEISISYIEIYNEIVYDLLSYTTDNKIIQHDKLNVESDDIDYEQLT